MDFVKRERWTEADVDALPSGEHDYFERKSGQLFDDRHAFLGTLAKALSAMANTGGGHIVVGVDDAGRPDGVPRQVGRTSVREWLEQQIPNLVHYPLVDFRVHAVDQSNPSRIPVNREIIVIDVGDSALAPHQCARDGGSAQKFMYYHRSGGRSDPAPHFYLELLRQRLVNPTLEGKFVKLVPYKAGRVEGGIFLATRLRFEVENTGRVAAYKWAVIIKGLVGEGERRGDYRSELDYPGGFGDNFIRVGDTTLLPGTSVVHERNFGFLLRPMDDSVAAIRADIDLLIIPVVIEFTVPTETSPGERNQAALRDRMDAQELAEFVAGKLAS